MLKTTPIPILRKIEFYCTRKNSNTTVWRWMCDSYSSYINFPCSPTHSGRRNAAAGDTRSTGRVAAARRRRVGSQVRCCKRHGQCRWGARGGQAACGLQVGPREATRRTPPVQLTWPDRRERGDWRDQQRQARLHGTALLLLVETAANCELTEARALCTARRAAVPAFKNPEILQLPMHAKKVKAYRKLIRTFISMLLEAKMSATGSRLLTTISWRVRWPRAPIAPRMTSSPSSAKCRRYVLLCYLIAYDCSSWIRVCV